MNKKFILNGTAILGVLCIAALVYYCKNPKTESDYFSPDVLATHFNGEQYVGSETCMECHADIYATHIETAHFNTSARADSDNIKGSFKAGSNTLDIGGTEFEMLAEGESFYQHTLFKGGKEQKAAPKFDIVIGSGVRGQSYLTWDGDKLFQLQASYYTPTDSWVNSPGFPSSTLTRPVRDACLKCHVTFATNRDFSGQGNQYDKERMVYGVDCEKCHRPAAKHVIYHRKNPDVKAPQFMMKYDSLSRQQRLDACAQCHSGPRGSILQGNSFTFLSGENLNEYSRNFYTGNPNERLDVHGNQYGLLTSSRCFEKSPTMDCSTCHDPHKKQRGNTEYFNQKCIGCHDTGSVVCKVEDSEMHKMANNCIACHMPITPSKSMAVQLAKDSLETSFYIRTHLIGIYQ